MGKPKITPEQLLEEVQNIIKPLAEKVNVLESKGKPALPVQNDIIINAQFAEPNTPIGTRKAFMIEFQALINKYKVVSAMAIIFRKNE